MASLVVLEDLAEDPDSMRKLWGLLLLMAIRDHASSVHYHPWREDGPLAYVIGNTRHTLRPPEAEWARECFAAAMSLLIQPRDRLKRFLFGWKGPTCGSLILCVGEHQLEWELVCWSSGRRFGVELFQIHPPTDAVPAGAAGRNNEVDASH